MSLPPGFIDELRTRLSLSQVVGRKVMWDPRKSNQGKGDFWAPCPFHQEKSASFHVDDRKGFYYCFGCQAKGDAISFVRETENVGFMEAIRILAQEAGLPVPQSDPRAQARTDRRSALAEVMEQAVRFFTMQLGTAAGGAARQYLDGRGLDEGARKRFAIGYAPDARQALWSHLTGAGVAPDMIVDAGLAARPDDGGAPYDRFRGRIIFPIRDGRGRTIALGGRAMSANARAKYLNSPETELFDKGRSLYNLGPAREAAGKRGTLIVAEGYMDVIALVQAGFEATVAPLGTAITENQLRMLWQISPEPVIALDGDAAGLRAAQRLIDLALPLQEAGQSLRFAILPEGKDPDDLIRAEGAQAMQRVVDGAVPMVRLLWQRETEGRVFDSPERKAALDKSLRDILRRIRDRSIRGHYADEIKRLRWDLFGTGPESGLGGELGGDLVGPDGAGRGGQDMRYDSAPPYDPGPYPDPYAGAGPGYEPDDRGPYDDPRDGGGYPDRDMGQGQDYGRETGREADRDPNRGSGRGTGYGSGQGLGQGGGRGGGFGKGRKDRGGNRRGWGDAPAQPLDSTRRSLLAMAEPGVEEHLREAVILAALVVHPAILRDFEAELETLELAPAHEPVRAALLRHGFAGDLAELPERIATDAGGALEKLFALSHVQISPPFRHRDDAELAAQTVRQELSKLASRRGVQREIDEASQDLEGLADEGLTWRLGQAAEARDRAERWGVDDSPDMGEDRDALSKMLQDLIDGEVWVKKTR
ncbi:DNA primase [Brevirhabdus pacifica]|uniref:DNA primase n=1 Tax=Brevirhabdus pacifica TaxID=1267768 RepID=A0A1U7DLZ4_9RHOB|nr:DNA primase [Brevirhabdus pacifica]APX90935.1 DNA primase [Brevirhabdus pacifica]OWU80384.1 DNA primase [Loktanella sp. 22II-4b]